jgi:hypothetical protein
LPRSFTAVNLSERFLMEDAEEQKLTKVEQANGDAAAVTPVEIDENVKKAVMEASQISPAH